MFIGVMKHETGENGGDALKSGAPEGEALPEENTVRTDG